MPEYEMIQKQIPKHRKKKRKKLVELLEKLLEELKRKIDSHEKENADYSKVKQKLVENIKKEGNL